MRQDSGIKEFRKRVLDHYHDNRRDMPWREANRRGSFNPYNILVSEIMLQQTQVARVKPKYELFIERFPTVRILADAPLAEVLSLWSGLGYNRRAKFLRNAAKQITTDYDTIFPDTVIELKKLPGVGPNTAAAVLVYSFNQPHVFIETNIRTVFIYHFFKDQESVSDKDILELVEDTIDHTNPREWYWALMDYGAFLKQTHGSQLARSRQHTKQSRFEGSNRQIRGAVIKILALGARTRQEMATLVEDQRLVQVLESLKKEGLIKEEDGHYLLYE